jgi:hypothetical protein
MRKIVLAFLIVTLTLPTVPSVRASGTITISANGYEAGIVGDLGNPAAVAQTFVGNDGVLSSFTLSYLYPVGSPVGSVSWSVRSGGCTNGIVASGSFTPGTPGALLVNVANGPYLSSGTTYCLTLTATALQTGSASWTFDSGGNDYANGSLWSSVNNGGAWSAASDQDLTLTVVTIDASTNTPITPTNTTVPGVTPTPTITYTPTATVTPTITPTPNLYAVSTLSSGQAAAVIYTVSVGEAANFAALIILIVIGLFGIVLKANK